VLAAQGAAPKAAAPVEDERIAAVTASGARVLLVEDNPINALLARTLLKREGAEVDRAASGQEALAAVAAATYDLILMDLRMPDLSGVEATRELRARGVTTPVVALTADAFEDDRRACLAAGMNDFLVKPLTETALRTVLARWVGWTGEDRTGQARLLICGARSLRPASGEAQPMTDNHRRLGRSPPPGPLCCNPSRCSASAARSSCWCWASPPDCRTC
jgi:CheY-like chemotaxis protein